MPIATEDSVTVSFDPTAINKQADVIGAATLNKAGVMTAQDKRRLTALSAVGGIILHWSPSEPWSVILARLSLLPPDVGAIVTMELGTYTMDVSANLDKVVFIALVESPTAFGGTPTTLKITVPLLGTVLYLINVVALTTATIFNGAGPFLLNLSGSAELSPDLAAAVPSIILADNGVLNASISQFSLFGGGAIPMVEMGQNSTINTLLTAAGIIGDKSAVLAGGAIAASVTAGLDSTCVVAGANGAFGNAFGPGITFNTYLNGNAFFGPYSPTVLANWSGSSPGDIGTALDRIAAKIGPIP